MATECTDVMESRWIAIICGVSFETVCPREAFISTYDLKHFDFLMEIRYNKITLHRCRSLHLLQTALLNEGLNGEHRPWPDGDLAALREGMLANIEASQLPELEMP